MRRKFNSANELAEPLRRRCKGVFALLVVALVVFVGLIRFAVVVVELFLFILATTGTLLAVVVVDVVVTLDFNVPLLMLVLLLTLLLSLFEPDCRLFALICVLYLLRLPWVVPIPSLVIP